MVDNVYRTYLSAALAVVLVAALLGLEGYAVTHSPEKCGYVMMRPLAAQSSPN